MRSFATCLPYGAFAAALLVVIAAPSNFPIQAATQSSTWEETWTAIKAAGKAEGRVVFRTGSSETQAYRQVLPEFEKAVGLKIQLLSGSPTQLSTKIVAELRAGKPSADLWFSGPSSIVNVFAPAGAAQNLKPLLVHPEVINPAAWFGGELPWASDWTLAFGASADRGLIVYNPKLLDPNDFESHWDILNPKWKGRIVMRDPRLDAVESNRNFFYSKLGEKFFIRLFDEMKPVIAPDARTAVEWVALGRYAFCLIGCNNAGEEAEAQGLSVKAVFPKILKEGFPVNMGGNGLTALSSPPHPAAAKYFINWFLSREGQIFYQKATGNYSLRIDIPKDTVKPSDSIYPDQARYHWYGWRYPESRAKSQAWISDMMKARGY
jgi:iron(III) transport system substrate-binding protein